MLLRVTGLTDAAASAQLGITEGGLAYWVAAVRECFEEAGILIGHDNTSTYLTPAYVAGLSQERHALNTKQLDFADFLASRGVFLHAPELAYLDHWITSPIAPRRFDTRFFVAIAPPGQTGSSDECEAVHTTWLRPTEALDLLGRQQMQIAAATESVLREVSRFGSAGEMFAYARDKRDIETNRPAVAQGSMGQCLFRRDAPAYAEVRWCDPHETMRTTYDLTPGVPKQLDDRVTRVIAPNPGMMTGPGTNTYIVGHRDLLVIDPGPAIDSHIAAILAWTAGRIRWIACTHTHGDHSPAAHALRAATGARLIGLPAPCGLNQDESFTPDWVVVHDEVLTLAGLAFRALRTPGHASNHVCYLLEDTAMLFAGDHVMQGSTVVINPPDGNMTAYLASLEALLLVDIAVIAPGHGYLIGAPHREIRKLLAHRLSRELKVIEAVADHPETAAVDLVPIAYADTPPRLHPVAARSLVAHLEKLIEEGRVTESHGRYALRRET
jgi:glyoxylase-like metal-dependent hydrolase (beta-lactamase superfamily II)/8-oxo-dGTP pyrophosphatase MutT (NUDIX family)